jgi:hypothetical protein
MARPAVDMPAHLRKRTAPRGPSHWVALAIAGALYWGWRSASCARRWLLSGGQHRGGGPRSRPRRPGWAYLLGAAVLPVGAASYWVTVQLVAVGFFPGWLT